jgi:hypothetical protein
MGSAGLFACRQRCAFATVSTSLRPSRSQPGLDRSSASGAWALSKNTSGPSPTHSEHGCAGSTAYNDQRHAGAMQPAAPAGADKGLE